MALRITTFFLAVLLLTQCADAPSYNGVEISDTGTWADSCEVTGIDFDAFMKTSGHKSASDTVSGYAFNTEKRAWEMASNPSYLTYLDNGQIDSLAPAVNVSWEDACAYCNAKKGRLPTADEWEKMADYAQVPGNIWEGYFPTKDEGKDGYAMIYAPVNEFKPNANGFYNLRGNVWEWTSTEVAGSYIIKGGSFLTDYAQGGFLPDVKVATPPNAIRSDVGFRCVYD